MKSPTEHTARIIDGKAAAARLRAAVAARVAEYGTTRGVTPGLAVVLVGDDPASAVYVRNKHRATVEAGMRSIEVRLPSTTDEPTLLARIRALNDDPAVHGILVQLPLPPPLRAAAVIDAIDPAKDVDGFHVVNAGRLATGGDGFVPCTPLGCLRLLRGEVGDVAGLNALVVGRSNIVGKPMAQLLLRENCTVTVAHSRTRDLAAECRRADILVAATGRPRMIPGDWIRPGAVVLDVGINRVRVQTADGTVERLVGDVDFETAVRVAGAITPVPGGVGPMTIACLLENTLAAAGAGRLDPDSVPFS